MATDAAVKTARNRRSLGVQIVRGAPSDLAVLPEALVVWASVDNNAVVCAALGAGAKEARLFTTADVAVDAASTFRFQTQRVVGGFVPPRVPDVHDRTPLTEAGRLGRLASGTP